MTGSKGYRESDKGEDSSLSFFELFGMETSYVDMQVAGRIVSGLIEHIEPQVQEGELIGLTIKGVSKEYDDELETILNQMKIYPWVEEEPDGTFTFSIENKREANRLAFFDKRARIDSGFKETETDMDSVHSSESVSLAPDPYVFPLPPTIEDPSPRLTYPRTPKNEHSGTDDDVPETDVWMRSLQDNFDQGLPLEGEEVESVPHRKGIDLKLFKNRYHFYKDAIKAPDGELLSWNDHKEVLLAAKHDPEKMKQAVDMSVGLVKMVVDRILKKFGGNEIYDADDLFQAGMEGLLYGLSKIEAREDSKPASYLVPCIEGSVRHVIRIQKRILVQPSHVADMVAKYRRAQSSLEREVPRFLSLTREQQEEKIIQKAGFSRAESRSVLKRVQEVKEPFDEEKYEPDFHEQNEAERAAEITELRQDISEVLRSLNPRDDLVLRLRFGIVDDSRFATPAGIDALIEESKRQGTNLGYSPSLQRLIAFDMQQDDFGSFNRAEQLFLALIEKVPRSWVEQLQHGDYGGSAATLEDIGAILGTSKEVVRQVEAKALRRLKHPYRSSLLSGHLD